MDLLTTGKIASRLGVDRDRVSHAIRKLAIQPLGTAGVARIFPEAALSAVEGFLKRNRVRKPKAVEVS